MANHCTNCTINALYFDRFSAVDNKGDDILKESLFTVHCLTHDASFITTILIRKSTWTWICAVDHHRYPARFIHNSIKVVKLDTPQGHPNGSAIEKNRFLFHSENSITNRIKLCAVSLHPTVWSGGPFDRREENTERFVEDLKLFYFEKRLPCAILHRLGIFIVSLFFLCWWIHLSFLTGCRFD